MLDRWRLKRVFRELERLGVPTDQGRLFSYDHDGEALSMREVLRCLRSLPDGAGRNAVDRALTERANARR
jgi:hypothetical protein